MTIKMGINGFGRIGRNVLRAAVQNFSKDIEIVAINDRLQPDYPACMLQADSVHGRFTGEIAGRDGAGANKGGERATVGSGDVGERPKVAVTVSLGVEGKGRRFNRF